jgi:hypothetical protein
VRRRILLGAFLSSACAAAATPAIISEPCLEETIPPYDRDEWGRWVDEDKDCQDTRAEVLIRDSEIPVTFADPAKPCRVISGRWTEPYTGLAITSASDLEIDHVVALEEAHESGGWTWDSAKKRAFYNDTANLRAVAVTPNRSKGSRGPEAWLPPHEPTRCPYLDWWTATKERWGLEADEGDVVAYMKLTCSRGGVPLAPQE